MKRIFLSFILVLLFSLQAHAQSSNFVPVTPNRPGSGFSCGLTNIAATLTECQAVPGVATVSYYIADIIVQTTTATAGTFAIRSGTGANCGTATAQVFPSSGSGSDRWTGPPTSAATAVIQFSLPLKVTAGHAICLIGKATDTTNVQINGFSQ